MACIRDSKSCKYLLVLPKHETRCGWLVGHSGLVVVSRLIAVGRPLWVGCCRFVIISWLIFMGQLLWLSYYGLIAEGLFLLVGWLLWIDCCGSIIVSQLLWIGSSPYNLFFYPFFRFQAMTDFLALATICLLLTRVPNPYLTHTYISSVFYQSYLDWCYQ